ncbi:hypothetical protein BD779DRAFT_1505213 [Infundibulicybe gibba]|nr:hypothetical protein BD779DRAFT_1505213 [Infundibulicybe gibba]
MVAPFTHWGKGAHLGKTVMKSHRFRIPKYDMPVRLRPWFMVFTCVIMVLLAFLGFTNFSRSLPLNDKLLHFLCFCLATGVFYFIIDVEEDARRIWFWRHSGLIFTGFVCFFCGGIVSEIVQSLLPYKEFQFGDVIANILGSSVGLVIAYHLERYYRRRREIARLYRPLNSGPLSDSDDDDDATQLLPLHTTTSTSKAGNNKTRHLTNVWDEREEVFDIGTDSDDEEAAPSQSHSSQVPKISVIAPQ